MGGVEYGASVDVSSDLLPKSIWGQTTTNIPGWNLKTRAEYTEGKYDHSTTDKKGVYVTASLEDQDVKIMHKIDEDNTASIKAGRSGFISASLENKGEFGSTTVTVTSDDVDIEVQKD